MITTAKGTARPAFERLLAILNEVASNKPVNQIQLSKRFGVSSKSIFRDFQMLTDRLLIPLTYNPHTRNWELPIEARKRVESIGQVLANLTTN